jgi:hypothetical protein
MGVVGVPQYHNVMNIGARVLIEDVLAQIDGIGR